MLCDVGMSLAGVETAYEFPPGHYFTPDEGFVEYYRVPEVQDEVLTDVEETCRLIRTTFTQAVKKRFLADKQIHVGSFCSGGLDSSLIAAITAEEIPNLHTFAVGMRDENGTVSDDLKAARIVADHIGSNHHELIFTEGEYYEALPRVIKKLESYLENRKEEFTNFSTKQKLRAYFGIDFYPPIAPPFIINDTSLSLCPENCAQCTFFCAFLFPVFPITFHIHLI